MAMRQRSLSVHFCEIDDANIDELRNINTAIFPVRYSDNFYNDVLELPPELAQFACVGHTVVGAICCRAEPLTPGQYQSNTTQGAEMVFLMPQRVQPDAACCAPDPSGFPKRPRLVGGSGASGGGGDSSADGADAEEPSKQRLYIMTLGVMAPYRCCGVGSKLLQLVLDNLAAMPSVREVYLHVQTSNEGAIAFYERAGFHKEAIIKNYYRRIEPPDCYLLIKRVNG